MNKTAIITGSSNGIGKATAELLCSKGYNVIGLSRSYSDLLLKNQQGYYELRCDVTDSQHVENAILEISKEFNNIDVLINCAGSGIFGVIEDISNEDVVRQLNIGILGYMFPIKGVLPIMTKQRSGHIINVTAAGARQYLPALPFYFAAKNAIDYLSHELRREVASFGIHLSVLEAGPVKTKFGKNMKRVTSDKIEYINYLEFANSWYKSLFLKRAVEPEVAAMAIYKLLKTKKYKLYTAWQDKLLNVLNKILPYHLSDLIVKNKLYDR